MNLTGGETFPTPLIKLAKTRFNQKIKFPLDTRLHIREIALNNDCNTHIVHILRKILDSNFFSN